MAGHSFRAFGRSDNSSVLEEVEHFRRPGGTDEEAIPGRKAGRHCQGIAEQIFFTHRHQLFLEAVNVEHPDGYQATNLHEVRSEDVHEALADENSEPGFYVRIEKQLDVHTKGVP